MIYKIQEKFCHPQRDVKASKNMQYNNSKLTLTHGLNGTNQSLEVPYKNTCTFASDIKYNIFNYQPVLVVMTIIEQF